MRFAPAYRESSHTTEAWSFAERNSGAQRAKRVEPVVIKPKIFIMENVDSIIKSNSWESAKNILKSGGCELTGKILDTIHG
jgi:site-specific DNA-cytosine methylase